MATESTEHKEALKGESPAWPDDKYIRRLLDARERWAFFLSLAGIAGLGVFLADHPPRQSSVYLGPLLIGLFGSFFVLVVNCYYKQAKAIANARGKGNEAELAEHDKRKWHTYARGDLGIGFLGWLHIVIPIVFGALATLTLIFGVVPVACDCG